MKHYLVPAFAAAILLSACGSSVKEKNAALNDKKIALEKLKAGRADLEQEIKKLEDEIVKLDPAASTAQKPKLVAVQTIDTSAFSHFIELQGKIESENISYISPRLGPGQVKGVFVKKGQLVHKGQLLLKLDDAVIKQSVAAARQSLETIKTQLAFAKNIAQRQQNLWDQKIGTEVQLITAKTNVATLEAQLNAAQENVKTVMEQMNATNVYSDVNGVADEVNIRVGETFTGIIQGVGPQIKIVNNSSLKASTNIPENYLGNVKIGSVVEIIIPDMNKTINSNVSFVGASIDPLTRGFVMESRIQGGQSIKPNQIALLRIKDYASATAITVPVSTLQNDEKNKFLMVAVQENGKLIARKRPVTIGLINTDRLEIKSGLMQGDVLITEGFQSLYDGQLITTQ